MTKEELLRDAYNEARRLMNTMNGVMWEYTLSENYAIDVIKYVAETLHGIVEAWEDAEDEEEWD